MQSRLTRPQRSLLEECIEDPRGMTSVVSHYSPARALVAKGFAVWRDDDPYTERLYITPEGRAALAKEGK